jgi:release factor glutamine methyltransferase
MISVCQLHQEIGSSLKSAGIEQPRLEAARILTHFLGLSRTALYVDAEKAVDPAQADLIREAGRQRALHVPLAYLLGETEFSGLIFTVGPGVSDPACRQ